MPCHPVKMEQLEVLAARAVPVHPAVPVIAAVAVINQIVNLVIQKEQAVEACSFPLFRCCFIPVS